MSFKKHTEIKKITVIGAGLIGASWTALFLANGYEVTVNDPRADLEPFILASLKKIEPSLTRLGYNCDNYQSRVRFESSLEKSIADADFIQENGPENLEFKKKLWAQIEESAPLDCFFLSSSSSKTPTEQSGLMKDGSRLVIGHPFNPPHLIPLVEVVRSDGTNQVYLDEIVMFYRAIGKAPKVIRKEIAGFVANRLQRAIFREACHLVKNGVCSVEELDSIVTDSVGLRWAVNGPFESYYMGGGEGGLDSFFKQFRQNISEYWEGIQPMTLDDELIENLVNQANAAYSSQTPEAMEKSRDEKQIAILNALNH